MLFLLLSFPGPINFRSGWIQVLIEPSRSSKSPSQVCFPGPLCHYPIFSSTGLQLGNSSRERASAHNLRPHFDWTLDSLYNCKPLPVTRVTGPTLIGQAGGVCTPLHPAETSSFQSWRTEGGGWSHREGDACRKQTTAVPHSGRGRE